jgi:hypothetical protein
LRYPGPWLTNRRSPFPAHHATPDQAQAILTHWLTSTLRELLPEELCTPELWAAAETLAEEKAIALTQLHPGLLDQLNDDDLGRICDSLRYHYEFTPCEDEDARNQAVLRKIARLT